jgi:hypothetical protein
MEESCGKLSEYGIPPTILNLIKEMYKGFRCKVPREGKFTESFIINTGERQGCFLSPILFLLVIDRIMRKTLDGRKRGIQWIMRERLEDLEFAADTCLLAQRLTNMKEKLKRLQGEAQLTVLNINVKKTKEMRANVTTTTEKLSIDGKEIDQVDFFTYLGSIMTGGEDVRLQIRRANGAFIQLYPIWKSKIISKKNYISIFNTNIKSVLLYACETWKVIQQISKRMQVFMNCSLHCILNLQWPDILSNEDLWGIIKQEPITAKLRKRK